MKFQSTLGLFQSAVVDQLKLYLYLEIAEWKACDQF